MTLAEYRLGELPRTVQDRLMAGQSAAVAEELTADAMGPNAKHTPNEAEWFDVTLTTTGTKVEVKSCWARIGDAYPANGRFILRRDQTRSLTASASAGSSGTAWYAFVLFSEEAGSARIRRARPATVRGWVEERGGWNTANHPEYDEQHKLPYEIVFSG